MSMRGISGPLSRGSPFLPPTYQIDPALIELISSVTANTDLVELLDFLRSSVNISTSITYSAILTVLLNSGIEISSALTFIRQLEIALQSNVLISTNTVFAGILKFLMDSGITISTPTAYLLIGQPTLHESANTWVVNLNTGASSIYDDYGFNSFAVTSEGVQYACAEDGIYQINPSISSSDLVNTFIQLAKTNFGTNQSKYIHEVWLGAASADKLTIKVVTEQGTYFYTARTNTANLDVNRVDLGKGTLSNYWEIAITGATDLELENVELFPIISSRRI